VAAARRSVVRQKSSTGTLVPDISHALNRIGPGELRRVGGEHKAVAYRRARARF
jgi:hypothetical protein